VVSCRWNRSTDSPGNRPVKVSGPGSIGLRHSAGNSSRPSDQMGSFRCVMGRSDLAQLVTRFSATYALAAGPEYGSSRTMGSATRSRRAICPHYAPAAVTLPFEAAAMDGPELECWPSLTGSAEEAFPLRNDAAKIWRTPFRFDSQVTQRTPSCQNPSGLMWDKGWEPITVGFPGPWGRTRRRTSALRPR
jgi:hypothetical protein